MSAVSAVRKGFEPWPFAIMVSFVVFVAANIALVVYLSRGFEGPDDMQYYRNGLEYGQVVRQQKRQRELGWTLDSRLQGGVLEVSLADASGQPLRGAEVGLKVGRPATQREDVRKALQEAGPGLYRAPLVVGPGVWDLQFTVRLGKETVVERVRVEGP